jgi:hypothetical protein
MDLTTSATFDKVKHSTESILFGVSFSPLLTPGELLTGTPTATTDLATVPPLVIAAPLVNTVAFTDDDGATVGIGQGVQVRLSGGLSPRDYSLTVTCGTSAANTRTIVCLLQVRDS